MPIDSLGNISGGWGGIGSIGSSGGLTIGGITIPKGSSLASLLGSLYNIPGWTASQNQAYNDTMTSYNAIEAANRRQQAAFQTNQLKNYEAMAQAEEARANSALQKLYGNLGSVSVQDDFLSSQIGSLQAAGVDTGTLAAFAAAGAKSGVANYATVKAQAEMALKAQQDYLDYIQSPIQARDDLSGQDQVNAWYSDIASKDINGTYASGLRDTVASLVEQLTSIQQSRQDYTNQVNALMGAAQIQNTTKTTKALMGITDENNATVDQLADVATGDMSYIETNKKSATGAAVESRGGGRYVTTTAKNASGLRI